MKIRNKKSNRKDDHSEYYRTQEMAFAFFKVLEISKDNALICQLYDDLMDLINEAEHFDDLYFFAFMSNYVEMSPIEHITMEFLTLKLQGAMQDCGESEMMIGWVGQALNIHALTKNGQLKPCKG